MALQRKLGRASDQRQALLRNQVTYLIWHGRIETTATRAKEVRSIAEKLITLAMREYENSVEVTKEYNNDKGQLVSVQVTNDKPSKLAARRRLMAYLYDIPLPREKDKKGKLETKSEYRERTKHNHHPVVEKLFREIAPKYKARKEEVGQGGGYTRIIRKGPRFGDGAEMVILELI